MLWSGIEQFQTLACCFFMPLFVAFSDWIWNNICTADDDLVHWCRNTSCSRWHKFFRQFLLCSDHKHIRRLRYHFDKFEDAIMIIFLLWLLVCVVAWTV